METLVQKLTHHPLAILLRQIGAAVLVAAFAFGMYLMVTEERLSPMEPDQEAAAALHTAAAPVRLIIPKINVDTAIQAVGKGPSGSMGVPTGVHQYHEVAWYRLGPRPGEKGNAVIAGHLDTGGFGFPAVFAHLEYLTPGDEILVIDEQNVTHRFVVGAVEEYVPREAPLERIFGPVDDYRLNLITCEGDWVGDSGQYTHRRVVYARQSE